MVLLAYVAAWHSKAPVASYVWAGFLSVAVDVNAWASTIFFEDNMRFQQSEFDKSNFFLVVTSHIVLQSLNQHSASNPRRNMVQ